MTTKNIDHLSFLQKLFDQQESILVKKIVKEVLQKYS